MANTLQQRLFTFMVAKAMGSGQVSGQGSGQSQGQDQFNGETFNFRGLNASIFMIFFFISLEF